LRYFDGSQWTEHVSSHGRQSVDGVEGPSKVPTVGRAPERIRHDVAKAGATQPIGGVGGLGGGSIFTESVLVVRQKAKLFEVNNEYAIHDHAGIQIGAVRQVGQSKLKKVLVDRFMTQKLQVVDMAGQPLLALTRPAKVGKSKVVVQDGAGGEIGQIVQENMVGLIRFGLVAGDRRVGSINAEERAWNFNIQDESGAEVARITKTWEGWAKTYVVHIHRPLDEPLRSLVVASTLTVETAWASSARALQG
jgi:uncharacterized protein YxjI